MAFFPAFFLSPTPFSPQVKLVLQRNRFMVESPHPDVLRALLRDRTMQEARVKEARGGGGSGSGSGNGEGEGGGGFQVTQGLRDRAAADLAAVQELDLTREGALCVCVCVCV